MSAAVALLCMSMSGCIGGAAAPDHGVGPSLRISGDLRIHHPPSALAVAVAWQVPGARRGVVLGERASVVTWTYGGTFTLELDEAPPEAAYDRHRWAVAQLVAFEDLDGDDQVDAESELLATSAPLSILFVSPSSTRAASDIPGVTPGFNVLRDGPVSLPGPGCAGAECTAFAASRDVIPPETRFILEGMGEPRSSFTVCEASISSQVLTRPTSAQERLQQIGTTLPPGFVADGGTLLTCNASLAYVYALCANSDPLCWPWDCSFFSGFAPSEPVPVDWPCARDAG